MKLLAAQEVALVNGGGTLSDLVGAFTTGWSIGTFLYNNADAIGAALPDPSGFAWSQLTA